MSEPRPLFDLVQNFDTPEWPDILTRANWNRKKGIVAKVYGRTGIGEECDKIVALYRAVHWDRLAMEDRMKAAGMYRWSQDTFTKKNYDKLRAGARGELGRVAALNVGLYDFEKLCARIEEQFVENKRIPHASAEHVKRMAAEAQRIRLALNQPKMSSYVNGVDAGVQQWVDYAVITMFLSLRKSVPPKMSAGLDLLKRAPTQSNFKKVSEGAIRDLNQALGNIASYGERGWGKKNPQCRKIFLALQPYATGTAGTDADDPDEVRALVKKIKPDIDKGLKLLATVTW